MIPPSLDTLARRALDAWKCKGPMRVSKAEADLLRRTTNTKWDLAVRAEADRRCFDDDGETAAMAAEVEIVVS